MNSNTALNNAYANGYCQYRLPCGYCEKLGRDCPKQGTYSGLTVQIPVGGTTGAAIKNLEYGTTEE